MGRWPLSCLRLTIRVQVQVLACVVVYVMVHLHCTLAVCAAVGPATGHAVNPSMEAQWRHPCRHMVPPPDPPPLCRYRAVRAKSEERRARNEERGTRNEERRAACVASAHAISRQKCSAPRAEMHLCRSAAQIMTKPCLRRSALVRDEAFPSIPSRTSALLRNARERPVMAFSHREQCADAQHMLPAGAVREHAGCCGKDSTHRCELTSSPSLSTPKLAEAQTQNGPRITRWPFC